MKKTKTVTEKILGVLEKNSGLCLDNETERKKLAAALVRAQIWKKSGAALSTKAAAVLGFILERGSIGPLYIKAWRKQILILMRRGLIASRDNNGVLTLKEFQGLEFYGPEHVVFPAKKAVDTYGQKA